MLTHENRNIKRHLDQIRDAVVDENEDNDLIDLYASDGEGESDSEHGPHGSQSFQSFQSDTTDHENTTDDSTNSPDTSAQNESIADVVERPTSRSCAVRAKEAITSMFASNQRK